MSLCVPSTASSPLTLRIFLYPSLLSLLSPPHPHHLGPSSFLLGPSAHTEKKGLGFSLRGPLVQLSPFTMASFSGLGLSPVCAPRSLPLPSSEHPRVHTQLPSSLVQLPPLSGLGV